RTRELPVDPPLKTQLAEFIRRGDTSEIALDGLGDLEAAALIRSSTDFEPAHELITRLQRQTGGNPFFLKQLATIFREDDAAPVDSRGLVPQGVTPRLCPRGSRLSPPSPVPPAFPAPPPPRAAPPPFCPRP